MKTLIHINQHNIKSNTKNKTNLPVITAKTYKDNRYGHTVQINGPSRLVYSPDKPLKCGARCWLETEAEVKVFLDDGTEVKSKNRIGPKKKPTCLLAKAINR